MQGAIWKCEPPKNKVGNLDSFWKQNDNIWILKEEASIEFKIVEMFYFRCSKHSESDI